MMFKPPKQRGNKDLTNCVMLVTKLEKSPGNQNSTCFNRSHLRNFHCQLFPEKGHFVGTLGSAMWLTPPKMDGWKTFFGGPGLFSGTSCEI